MNLLNDRSAMQAHLSLHGWFAVSGKASFDEVPIYRLVNPALGMHGEVLSIRKNEREVFRMGAHRSVDDRVPFDEIPDREWERLLRRAIGLNLVEGIDGKESSTRPGQ